MKMYMTMKKLLTIMAVAMIAAACEGPVGPMGPRGPEGSVNRLVIDNITVVPNDWEVALTSNGDFDYFFADKRLDGFTSSMLNNGFYYTYWKYLDGQILVQEGLGVSMHLERLDGGQLVPYTETIGCSYSTGEIRFSLSRSDFWDARPTADLVFRFVAFF